MISRTLPSPVEATVPPVPLTWKKSGSLNSHASVACAMAVPALADPVGFLGRPHARLEVGQLHRLPQPVDDVVDLELEQQLHFALVAPAGSLFTLPLLAPGSGKHVPRLGLALARALLFLRAAQPEMIV